MAVRARQRTIDPAILREYAEDDRLSAAANAGDRAAAGMFLLRNQRMLLTTARRLATSGIDPDDLLADALVGLLSLWKSGTGPKEKAGAYVIRSMRNRMIDEFRSPRSRVLPLVDTEDNLPTVMQDTRHIELDAEYRRVRTALLLLPDDQQQVLRATIIDGRKPAELEEELGRPASSIYALSLRARKGLRRAMLRVILEEDDPPAECRHAATRLPPVVTEDVDDAADSAGMEHIRDCPRCRAAWGRFGTTASLLGVATVLLIGNIVLGPTSAEASEEPTRDAEPPAESSSSVSPSAGSPSVGSSAPSVRGGAAASVWQVVGNIWPVLAIVTGLGILGVAVVPPVIEQIAAPAPIVSELVVTSDITGQGTATLAVSLTGREESSTVSLTLPEGLAVVAAPTGWECRPTDAALVCTVEEQPDGLFVLSDDRAEQVGDYRLEVSAVIGDQNLTGSAWGQIGPDSQTVRASID
ncbi:sigma-70 family RNA polymerase sigma factor [Microbacterium galbinum]|uniref:sigma-70 family RNA polymerase sigma factor n=1 Tax=Microbacterium galbinum TaxID=2851646 RepID=UPI001FFD334B|nr:sigma-70 family RNA polymerase sigma factor [Microbacterium galbinum]MCK2030039.1 sigma-70 family RNA polymerase sigma factor [Microbacterium galbinum]